MEIWASAQVPSPRSDLISQNERRGRRVAAATAPARVTLTESPAVRRELQQRVGIVRLLLQLLYPGQGSRHVSLLGALHSGWHAGCPAAHPPSRQDRDCGLLPWAWLWCSDGGGQRHGRREDRSSGH